MKVLDYQLYILYVLQSFAKSIFGRAVTVSLRASRGVGPTLAYFAARPWLLKSFNFYNIIYSLNELYRVILLDTWNGAFSMLIYKWIINNFWTPLCRMRSFIFNYSSAEPSSFVHIVIYFFLYNPQLQCNNFNLACATIHYRVNDDSSSVLTS